MRKLVTRIGLLALVGVLLLAMPLAASAFSGHGKAAVGGGANGRGYAGAVYVMTNASANAIVVYGRKANGALVQLTSVATGGQGTGAALGSQGALVLSADGRWLFAVNAASNDISVFRVGPKGTLTRTDVEPAGGTTPVSLTFRHGLLYVLDAGGSGNIAGFRLNADGTLTALPGSVQPLSNAGVGSAPNPAQIGFAPNGHWLVVTEKATNLIDVFPVKDGIAAASTSYPSAGATPFGFAFAKRGTLIVSEPAGAVSSYRLKPFSVLSASVSDAQSAACWVVVTNNGKFAFVTNAGSGTISSYRVLHSGRVALLESVAATTGDATSHPLDLALSNNSRFLYSLNAGAGTIGAFRVGPKGTLAPLTFPTGLPASAAGIAAK